LKIEEYMEIRIALVGIGGYGEGYAQTLLNAPAHRHVILVAGIDPAPERCRSLADFYRLGVPIYPDLETFFTSDTADLVVISSPIHYHAPQACVALAHGSNVLCEKPVCAVIQDARRMAEAETLAGKLVAVGYQMSFSPPIQALKKDILSGVYGSPKRLKTIILWPRTASYYHRNNWAGKIKSEAGEWVLDSPANNAMAHYLHNALYLLGDTPTTSARPASVQAELYRANPIENYDAAVLRVLTENNTEVLFYGAHTVPDEAHPAFSFEFDAGTIEGTAYQHRGILARFNDGSLREYGDPTASGVEWEKLWQSVDAIRTGKPISCGIAAASAHTLCINGAQESTEITPIPPKDVRITPRGEADALTWVAGMQEALTQSYTHGCLPSDLGTFPWAHTGDVVNLSQYMNFPSKILTLTGGNFSESGDPHG
jgi:predicted dehydrogenase